MKIWDAGTGECRQQFFGHKGIVRDVDWSPDGSKLAAAVGSTVQLWETDSWQVLKVFSDAESAVQEIAFRGDSRQLAAAGLGIAICIYDLQRLEFSFAIAGRAPMRSVAFSPSGHHLVAGISSGGPRIWKSSPANEYHLVLAAAEDGGAENVNVFSTDGQQLLTAIEETKQLRLWDFTKLVGYKLIEYPEDCLAASFAQQVVATRGADAAVSLRAFRTGERLSVLAGHQHPVDAAAFFCNRRTAGNCRRG